MSDGADVKSSWARYIEQATQRPGWNAAKLARESGVHRSTIFRWKAGDSRSVTVDSVRRIADALGDDPDEALRAAGDLVAGEQPHGEDEDIAVIMRAPVSDAMKDIMIAKLREARERDRQQRIAYARDMIDLAKREE